MLAARCQGCRQQFRSMHAFGRRITSPGPGRRKGLASDVFTACYTGMMATAAVVDAGWKDERRQELDREIERTKTNIAKLMEQSGAPDLAEIVTESSSYTSFLPSSASTTEDMLTQTAQEWFNVREAETQLIRWRQEATASSHFRFLQQHLDAQDFDAEEQARCEKAVLQSETKSRWTWPLADLSQLSQASECIVSMVDDLLEKVYEPNPESRLSPDSAFNAIRMLRSDGYPIYRLPEIWSPKLSQNDNSTLAEFYLGARHKLYYARRRLKQLVERKAAVKAQLDELVQRPGDLYWLENTLKKRISYTSHHIAEAKRWVSRAKAHHDRILSNLRTTRRKSERPRLPDDVFKAHCRINEANRKVFAEWGAYRRDQSVAKICYNFLVSPYTPSVHNYNVVLLGLSNVGEHELAQVVADHVARWNYRLPGGATILCLLNHYRRRGDYREFRRLLRRLLGGSEGPLVEGRTLEHTRESPYLQLWAEKYAVGLHGDTILERQRLNCDHWNAIVQSLLHFGNIRGAASLFIACLSEGHWIHTRVRDRLFSACIDSLDRVPARILVDGLLRNIEQATTIVCEHRTRKPCAMSPDEVQGSRMRGYQLRQLLNIFWAHPASVKASVEDCPGKQGGANAARPLEEEELLLMPARIQYLGTLAWVKWIEKHLQRVEAILTEVQAALAGSQNGLLELSEKMAEEHWFQRHDGLMESTRSFVRLRWLEEEVESSSASVERMKRIATRVILFPKLRSMVDLLDHAPYGSTVRLFDELGKPASRVARISECILESRSAELVFRSILMELLQLLTPTWKQQAALKKAQLKTTSTALFSHVSYLLERQARMNDEKHRRSLMEQLRAWVPTPWSAAGMNNAF